MIVKPFTLDQLAAKAHGCDEVECATKETLSALVNSA